MKYKIILLSLFLIESIYSAEAPLIKEKITPQNLQAIHEKITSEIYTEVLRRIENPRRTTGPLSLDLQKKSLDIAYLTNIVACGHNPSEAEHTWSLHNESVMLSNMYLCIAYMERFVSYDYSDVIQDVIMPNQVMNHRVPAIIFKEGIGILLSPSQIIARSIMKKLKIQIEKVSPANTKKGCCTVM